MFHCEKLQVSKLNLYKKRNVNFMKLLGLPLFRTRIEKLYYADLFQNAFKQTFSISE